MPLDPEDRDRIMMVLSALYLQTNRHSSLHYHSILSRFGIPEKIGSPNMNSNASILFQDQVDPLVPCHSDREKRTRKRKISSSIEGDARETRSTTV